MSNDLDKALQILPDGLREPLITQYEEIAHNFAGRQWSASELSGGHFCEIVYSILDGHAKGAYSASPSKPTNFVQACRNLESNTTVPRSFQILIPRLLPAIYEIRNNRGVGHAGGDVDPNFMDSSFVLASASWIMGELVRVLYCVNLNEAKAIVSQLSERKNPAVWIGGGKRRLLIQGLKLQDQVLLLIGSSNEPVSIDDLGEWLEHKNQGYVKRIVNALHKSRMVEFTSESGMIELLPPGTAMVSNLLAR